MRRQAFVWIFISLSWVAEGQQPETLPEETVSSQAQNDDSAYEPTAHRLIRAGELVSASRDRLPQPQLIKFDEEKWKTIVGEENFRESREETQRTPQWSLPWAGPVLKVISYVVIIGLVLWLLYVVLKNVSSGQRITRVSMTSREVQETVENIEELDVQTLLEQARNEGNFRLAVRLYYLGLLKKLHAINAIGWKKDKTNREYLSELFSRNFFYDDVRRLTLSYEALWYGDHSIGPESFRRLSVDFETLYEKINESKAS